LTKDGLSDAWENVLDATFPKLSKLGFASASPEFTLPSFTMVKGQKVVCINDTFPPHVFMLYKQLPKKGDTYTVREVFLGREKVVKGGESATVGLLLEELTNPPDPFLKGKQELGFSSERFAPLEELPDEEAVAEDALGAGAFAGAWAN
jgi:hypothetical protein